MLSLICAVMMSAAARGDDVSSFLEQHGLRQLLAVHLEQQLDSLTGESRQVLLRKLSALYAELLESEDDLPERQRLEQRGRDLVAHLPEQDAGALRLALLRGSYRTAERIAENHRLRLVTDEEIEQARTLLTEIIPKFSQLRHQLQKDIELYELRLTRASGPEASRLFADLARVRAMTDECTFYNAWALYYQSWLNERPDNAKVAIRLFSELLDLDTFSPDPNEVSLDLRSMEAVARSILGIALCKSLTASAPTAINWITLIEHESAYRPLRDEAPVWRMAIWLEHDEFARVGDELATVLQTGREIPSPWLRLIAVQALERGQRDHQATALVRYAVTQLASREALDQVLDLAQRYGTSSLGDEGFALRYVSGVMIYSDARAQHGSESPTTDAALTGLYAQATAELETALGQEDVENYPDAATACRRLIGYCLYFQGRFLEAKASFVETVDRLGQPDQAAEALWMAIVCLDRIEEVRPDEALEAELDELMRRFLDAYPSSAYAPKIMLKQAMASREPTIETVDRLLEIPRNSDVYESARRRASMSLYQLFRKASGAEKQSLARRFLEVTLPMMTNAMRLVGADGSMRPSEMATRCRMLLEIALTEDVLQLSVARQAFLWLDELRSSQDVDLEPYQDELDYRHLLERLHSGETDEAAQLAETLWGRDEHSIWSRLSSRMLFDHGRRIWMSVVSNENVDLGTLHLVDRFGGRILHETAGDPAALSDPVVLGYHATVADAARIIWERTGDELRGRAALTLYERLLRERPANASFLRSTALLSVKLDKPQQALDCWRVILSGSDIRSEAWFEAKFHQIAILTALGEYERARAVLRQHHSLNPDYGPEPWGSRLKGLERQLENVPASADADREGGAA